MIKINYRDSKPLYEQIKDEMKKLIVKGVINHNDRIPSVRELAVSLSINPNTIQRAYRELESEGYIYSVRAKGFFVAELTNLNTERVNSIKEDLKKSLTELYYMNMPQEKIMEMVEKIYKEVTKWLK